MANYYSYFDDSTAGQNTRDQIDDESAIFGMGVSQDINCGILTASSVICNATTIPFYPPVVTTTQRDAMTVTAGAMVYNSSTNKLNYYDGSAWKVVSVD